MSGQSEDYSLVEISGELDKDIKLIKNIFKKEATLRMKKINARAENTVCAAFYLDGMASTRLVNESVVKPLLLVNGIGDSISQVLKEQVLFAGECKAVTSVADMLRAVLYGDTLLLISGSRDALVINTKGWRTRGISEPENERVLQGPREGFDEAALLNLAMVRRRLLTPDLCTEAVRIGRRTETYVFICYLGSLTDEKMLKELKRRLSLIDIDGILDSNYITEQIRDCPGSLFKTAGTTERPDVVAARLLEGRIAIITDGTPVAVTVPYLFSENFQSDEDYYLNYTVSSVGRILRYLCFFLAISIPAVFIAAAAYHRELLPTSLAISLMQLRGGVPFPALTECIMLIFIFEILKETGIRMAQSLGHALSIVGGLVVGQAAVEARIISAPVLIVVALSGIAGLTVPRLKGAVFYLRLILVVLSALFGLYGYITGIAAVIISILDLKSFGVSSTVSLSRLTAQSLKDSVVRAPWRRMIKRPLFNINSVRMKRKDKK